MFGCRYFSLFIVLEIFLIAVNDFSFEGIISGVTLIFNIYREELSYIPGDKRAMFLGVSALGVPGIFALEVTIVSMLTVLVFFIIWF